MCRMAAGRGGIFASISIYLPVPACACRKSNPSVLVMQAAENRSRLDASY
jgi:hypothetical protein